MSLWWIVYTLPVGLNNPLFLEIEQTIIEEVLMANSTVESLDKIIELYGKEFSGKSFGENFISCNIGELQEIQSIFAEYNLKMSDIPDYYFRYDSEILRRCCTRTNGSILTEEALMQTFEDAVLESYSAAGQGRKEARQGRRGRPAQAP